MSEQAKSKTKLKVTFNLQKNQTRKASKDQDEEKFLELLSRAQSSRMDDQRGLGTSTSEIPEFLRSKMEYPSGRESAPPILKQDSSKREGVIGTPENYVQNDNKYFASYTRGQVATRPSSVPADSFLDHSSSRGFDSVDESQISHEDQSFSADGVIPSSSEAEVYFQTTDPDSADFDDPRLRRKDYATLVLTTVTICIRPRPGATPVIDRQGFPLLDIKARVLQINLQWPQLTGFPLMRLP